MKLEQNKFAFRSNKVQRIGQFSQTPDCFHRCNPQNLDVCTALQGVSSWAWHPFRLSRICDVGPDVDLTLTVLQIGLN